MTENKIEARPTVWKLEGEAFEQVKAAREAYAAARKQADAIVKEAHKELWDTIYQTSPEIDSEGNLSLDVEYEEAGFYVVKKKPGLAGIGELLDLLSTSKKQTDEAA